MRAYTIALFLLMIQIGVALVNTMGVFDSGVPLDTSSEGSLHYANTTLRSRSFGNQTIGQGVEYERSSFSDIVNFGKNLFNVAATFESFGLPTTYSWLFAAPVYFIWIFALAQVFLRKGVKDIT